MSDQTPNDDQIERADEEAARAAAAAADAAEAAAEAEAAADSGEADPEVADEATEAAEEAAQAAATAAEAAAEAAEAPKPKRARKARDAEVAADQAEDAADEATDAAVEAPDAPAPAKPRRSRAKAKPAEEPVAETPAEEPVAETPAEPAAPRRKRTQRSPSPGTGDRRRPVETGVAVSAHAKYVRTSARKARLVCDHIRGKDVEQARAILAFTPRAAAKDWAKLLESAVANAEHNHELVGEELKIAAVYADEGPTLKRFRPRAMGRATRIRKRTSHLTITLTPKEL
jgi:ribosomal protein L22